MTLLEQYEMILKGRLRKQDIPFALQAAEAVFMPSKCNKSNEAVLDAYKSKLKLLKYSEATIKRYSITLRHYDRYTTEHQFTIASASYEHLMQYIEDYAKRDSANASGINFVITNLKNLYDYMFREEWIGKNPMNRIDKIKEPKRKKRAFTDKEVKMIREYIESPRDRAIFELMISSGLRKSEIVALNIKDIDFNTLSVKVIAGKGNKDRSSVFDDNTKKCLKKYLSLRDSYTEDDPMFTTDSKNRQIYSYTDKRITTAAIDFCFYRLRKDLNLEPCSAHICRHKFATDCYTKRHMKIEYISNLMGHSSTNVTMRYIDIDHSEAVKQYRAA